MAKTTKKAPPAAPKNKDAPAWLTHALLAEAVADLAASTGQADIDSAELAARALAVMVDGEGKPIITSPELYRAAFTLAQSTSMTGNDNVGRDWPDVRAAAYGAVALLEEYIPEALEAATLEAEPGELLQCAALESFSTGKADVKAAAAAAVTIWKATAD